MNITKLLGLISGTAGTQSRPAKPVNPGNQAEFAALVTRFQGALFGFLGRMGFGQAQVRIPAIVTADSGRS